MPQEPVFDLEATVRDVLESSFANTTALLREYEAITAKMGEEMSDDDMQAAIDRMGVLQDKLDAVRCVEPRHAHGAREQSALFARRRSRDRHAER